MLKPLTRRNLAELAVEAIKRYILHENLHEGDRLPGEEELAESLAVSRNIIREALTSLATEGIITRQTGRGTFVQPFDREALAGKLPPLIGPRNASVKALYEFRMAVELGALEYVVLRATDEDLSEMDEILQRYERRQMEGKSPAREDIAFHLALLKSTHNEVFLETAPLIAAGLRERVASRPESLVRFVPGRNDVQHHRQILQAIRDRDIVEAQRAFRSHIMEENTR
jgi:GntR family transcriptional regulator, transcriptional repressor for pyruvate dehydrogenase complex